MATGPRRRLLDELLHESGARALVVWSQSSDDPAILPFAGPGRMSPCLAVAPRGGEPLLGFLNPMERSEASRAPCEVLTPEELDVPRLSRDGAPPEELWAGVVARALRRAGVPPGASEPVPLALAGCLSSGIAHGAASRLREMGWELVPGESVARRLRKRKTDAEIDELRRVADGAMEAQWAVARRLAAATIDDAGRLLSDGAWLRVGDLRAEIASVFARHGLEQPERNIVAPAEEGAVPHETGSDDRGLRAGESLIVDLFPCRRLFADCTRTFCVTRPGDEPPAALAAAHADVEAAVRLAEEHAVPGARGWDLQVAVCEHLAAAGWETPWPERDDGERPERGYVHGLGHGVGAELHELPVFSRHASDAKGSLEPGDVITLEPGLYEPAPDDGKGWAVRLEDTYLVKDDGVESLTPLPRALDPREW